MLRVFIVIFLDQNSLSIKSGIMLTKSLTPKLLHSQILDSWILDSLNLNLSGCSRLFKLLPSRVLDFSDTLSSWPFKPLISQALDLSVPQSPIMIQFLNLIIRVYGSRSYGFHHAIKMNEMMCFYCYIQFL